MDMNDLKKIDARFRLQFITHRSGGRDELGGARAVLEGGCRWVQLRMKDASDDEVRAAGRELSALCRAHGAVFLLDDRAWLVDELGADGVHVGKNDIPVAEVRRLLGPSKIVGSTANCFEDIRLAAAAGADYIGLGPFRFTTTKKNLSPVLGLEGYRSISEACRAAGLTLPVVAIGGIEAADIPGILDCGVAGIAVSGTLLRAEDTAAETRRLLDIIEKSGNADA